MLYPELLGLPEWLAHVESALFEHLPREEALLLPEQLLESIPLGADVAPVQSQLVLWLLTEAGLLVVTDRSREAVSQVAELYARELRGDKPQASEWTTTLVAGSKSPATLGYLMSLACLAYAYADVAAISLAWMEKYQAASKKIAQKLLELLAAA